MNVSLTWPVVQNAASYNVYRSDTTGNLSPQLIGSTTGLSWDDIPPLPGTWYYVITALNADGESLFSIEFPAPPDGVLSPPTSISGIITT